MFEPKPLPAVQLIADAALPSRYGQFRVLGFKVDGDPNEYGAVCRGIGLINKIRAYSLQDSGLDTVEANLNLGFADDLRSYDTAAAIVASLGIRSVYLLSNNPKKKAGLERHNVPVIGMIPVRIPANDHNRAYLETKKQKSGHLL